MNDLMFDSDTKLDGKDSTGPKVHIRIKQRNARKSMTTIEGLDTDIEPKKILKAMRKRFSCNGNLETSEEIGLVIRLQGDQRENIREFLVDIAKILNAEDLVIHGF